MLAALRTRWCDPLGVQRQPGGCWPWLLSALGGTTAPGAALSRAALALRVCPPRAEGRTLVLQQR